VSRNGVYTFYTSSNDGSRLYIGDTVVVDNDDRHTAQEKSGMIALKTGMHPITVTYFNHIGEETLAVTYNGPGIKKKPIDADSVFHTTE